MFFLPIAKEKSTIAFLWLIQRKKSRDLSSCDGEWQLTLYNSFVFVCMCVFVNSSAVFCLTRSQSTWGVSEISTCGQCHFHPIGKVFNYSTWTAEDYVDQRLLGRTKRVIEGHLSRWTNLPCHSFVKWFGNISMCFMGQCRSQLL